jgi:hypothetical protein
VTPAVPVGLPPRAPVPPTVATPAPTTAQPVVAAALPSRRLQADDSRTRAVVLAELVLLLVTFGLLGQGPLAPVARLLGPVAAQDAARGIGRFRAVRVGSAPRL